MNTLNCAERFRSFVMAAVAPILMLPSGVVFAQAGSQDGADEEEIEEIVVLGVRRSLESALATKRLADTILDSISSEGIGRFPDLNLAESLQRITGVQIERDALREGQIAVRGLPNGYALTQVNGMRLASPNFAGGGFVYGALESDIVTAVDVVKSPRADMDAGGLSGIVNVRTLRPLSIRENFLRLRAVAVYEELAGDVAPKFGLSAGGKFLNDRLGAFVSTTYSDQFFRRDTARVTAYRASDRSGDGLADYYTPSTFRASGREHDGVRVSTSAGIEFAATDALVLGLTAIYSTYEIDNLFDQIRIFSPRSVEVLETVDSGKFGETVTRSNFINPDVDVESRLFEDEFSTYAITADAALTFADWTATLKLHTTEGGRDRFAIQSRRRMNNGDSNNASFFLDQGGGNEEQFGFEMIPDSGDPATWSLAVRNVATLFLASDGLDRTEKEDAVRLDFSREFADRLVESISFGVKFANFDQLNRQPTWNRGSLNLSGIDDFGVLRRNILDTDNGFDGELPGIAAFWVPDVYQVWDAVLAASDITGPTVGGLPLNERLTSQYDSNKSITSAYFLARFNLNSSSSIPLRGNLGVRYVQTERDVVAWRRSPFGNEFASAKTEFDDVLPAANFIFDLREDLIFRLSAAKTIVRPSPQSHRASQRISVSWIDAAQTMPERISISLGNPDLKPFSATSFDASLEWYNRQGSAIALAYFQKKIKDGFDPNSFCPASITSIRALDSLDLSGVITGSLSESSGDCLDEAGAEISITGTTNNNTSFDIRGFEIGVLQNLDFLPAPWNGFGFQANYTYIDTDDSSDLDESGNPLPLENVSENTFNVIAYFETERFGIRLAHNFRDDYFVAATSNTFAGNDRLRKATNQLDLSASFEVSDNLRLTFEGFNLLNKKLIEYQGVEARFRSLDLDGRTFTLGAQYVF